MYVERGLGQGSSTASMIYSIVVGQLLYQAWRDGGGGNPSPRAFVDDVVVLGGAFKSALEMTLFNQYMLICGTEAGHGTEKSGFIGPRQGTVLSGAEPLESRGVFPYLGNWVKRSPMESLKESLRQKVPAMEKKMFEVRNLPKQLQYSVAQVKAGSAISYGLRAIMQNLQRYLGGKD